MILLFKLINIINVPLGGGGGESTGNSFKFSSMIIV